MGWSQISRQKVQTVGGDQYPNRSLQDADAAGGGDGGAEGAVRIVVSN